MTRVRPELAIVAAAALWGTTGTAQDLADLGASPVAVGATRILLGGIILGVVAGAQGGPPGHGRRLPLIAGSLAVAGYQVCFFAAVDRAGVALGTLVAIGSAPVLTGLVAAVVEGERPVRRWYPATGLAVLGCALLLGPGGDADLDAIGLLLALGAGFAYSVYTVAAKVLLDDGVPGTRVVATMFLGGAVVLLPTLFFVDTSGLTSGRGLAMILWLGVAATAVAYVLFAQGLARLRASTVATLSLTEPLTAAVLGVVVLDERPGGVAFLGALILLSGLIVMIDRSPAPAA